MTTKQTHVNSWYAASVDTPPARNELDSTIHADVCILGAGITGLSTAIECAKAGLSVVVLEANQVGWGASGRNGGQAIFGFGCDQHKITAMIGLEDSRKLFDFSLEGMRIIQQRCEEFNIDCDWTPGHVHVAIKPRHIAEIKSWQSDLEKNFSYPLPWWNQALLHDVLASPRYIGGLYDINSGHLHPLKYTLGLARAAESLGVKIFEHSAVTSLSRGNKPTFKTARGQVQCSFAMLAGNAYVKGITPELDRKIMPVGTYVGATAPLEPSLAQSLIKNNMAVADINWALDYFRFSKDYRLLFGGRASYSTLPPPNLQGVMTRRMHRVFPQLKNLTFEYLWGGFIDISLNRAPHWGRIEKNIYFAQGFSGHGIAATGLAGKIISEAICGQAARLDIFEKITHLPFPGGRLFRTPMLVTAMAWYKFRDAML
jgi:gamma-glutamylputrescine oxidase